jgi:pimeloyl-ACP methyl ester carboxylesterase
MRARHPDDAGFIERDGVRVGYEMFGDGEPAILLLPTWAITHSRMWKGQVPYFARHTRVLTFDPRGNGRSDRPTDPRLHADSEVLADAIDVLDATGTDRAIVVGISDGGWFASLLAVAHPERVAGVVMIGTATPLGEPHAHRTGLPFDDVVDDDGGWRGKWNRHHWLRDYRGFLEWFAAQIFNDPHSTKQREDAVRWGLETDAETLLATQLAPRLPDDAAVREVAARVRCPVLVMHGRTRSGRTIRARHSRRSSAGDSSPWRARATVRRAASR